MSEVCLQGRGASARIVPSGGRVDSIVDTRSGRELLARFARGSASGSAYLEAFTGGWEVLFPNDAPHEGLPDHGTVWSAAFRVAASDETAAVLEVSLGRPDARLERHYELLDAPRRGLRVRTTLTAGAAIPAALFASHVALAVEPGATLEWDGGGRALPDAEAPGRFADAEAPASGVPVPPLGGGYAEVLYVDGASSVTLNLPSGARTRVAWDPRTLPHVWLVAITGAAGLPLCLIVEPATSRPFDIVIADQEGRALTLQPGQAIEFDVTVESLERTEPTA